jgi:hypothetical protein
LPFPLTGIHGTSQSRIHPSRRETGQHGAREQTEGNHLHLRLWAGPTNLRGGREVETATEEGMVLRICCLQECNEWVPFLAGIILRHLPLLLGERAKEEGAGTRR